MIGVTSSPQTLCAGMANSNILTPEDTREFLGKLFTLPETTLTIEVARSCNLRCRGCWVGISRHDLWTSEISSVIDDSLLNRALSLGRNLAIDKLGLVGGEPTLHPNLGGIIRQARAMGYKSISVTTNGVVSAKRLCEIISSGIANISFSIDGSHPELHNRLRPSPNGKDTFHITMRNLEFALANSRMFGYEVRVNNTVYARNAHDTESLVRFLSQKGVKKIRLHFTMPEDLDVGVHISPSHWLELYAKLKCLAEELDIQLMMQPVYGSEALSQARFRKSPYMHLQPDGNLILCAAYARLTDSRKRSFAFIQDEQRISVNPQFFASGPETNAVCCHGVPKLISQMPKELRDQAYKHGMGCIILQSPISGEL